MKKSFLSKVIVAVLVVLSIFAMTFVVSAEETTTNVAKIGDTEYATLQAAMAEANKAAGDYTITLLKDSAEVFTFAQKSGVNITIDGGATAKTGLTDDYRGARINDDGFAFSGKITLVGAGSLKFTKTKMVAPAGGSTGNILLYGNCDLTIDNCVLTCDGAPYYTATVWGYSGTSNVVFSNCTASNLTSLYHTNQAGCNTLVIKNVVATKMVYLTRSMKVPSVTVSNVTYSGQTFVQVKNSVESTLAIENVNVTTTATGMPPVTMLTPEDGVEATVLYTITLKGENVVNGANMTKNNESVWFATEENGLSYEIVDLNWKPVAQIGEQGYATLQEAIDAANDGDTIKLIADIVFADVNDIVARAAASNGNGTHSGFDYGNGAFVNVIAGNVTVDLNGHSITYNLHHNEWCNKRVVSIFYVTDKATLTITDSADTGAVTVNGMATAIYSVAAGTKATIAGGTWTWNPCKTCGATNVFLYASHGGELYVTGGKFVNNVTGDAGDYMFLSHYSSKETTENSAGIDYDATKIAISGGTFENYNPGEIKFMDQGSGNKEEVDSGCAPEFAPVKNADGTYGIVDAVAQIGTTGYATLAEAIAAANAIEGGATITLLKDVTIGEKFTIKKDITISGAYTITRADNYTGTFFVVNANVTLTLDGGLVIDGGNEYAFDKEAYMADAESRVKIAKEDSAKWFVPEEGAPIATAFMFTTTGGTINFNNVTIQNNYSVGSGIVSVGANSTVTLTGAKIKHIAATQGNGIVVNASGANINIVVNAGTVIDGNHVGSNHGLFKVYSGAKLTMNGGEITNNTGWNSNGIVVGLYGSATIDGVVHGSAFIFNGGIICSNVGANGPNNGRNAPIYGHTQHVFIMNGGTICHNSGAYAGLDAPYDNGTTEINGGAIVDNVSFSNNSFADINASTALEITGGTFTQVIKPEWIASDSALVANSNGTYGVDKVEKLEEFAQAKIGDTYYTTLKKAVEAAQNGDTITLLADVALDAGVTNTKKVTLDLNGKTITGTDNATGSFAIITNKGELTITGNGTITLTATNNRGWNAYSSVISNTVGGKLIVTNGTIEHRGGTDMAYAIDNLTNGKGTYAETVINGGTIKSTYRAIRQFLNGVEAQNILTVNGGTIEGTNKAIWMQDSNASANPGTLTVKDTAVINGDIFLSVTAGSTEWPVEISIADSALAEGKTVLTSNVPAKYAIKNVNDTWSVYEKIDSVAVNGSYTYNGSEQTAEIIVKIGNVVLTSNDYIVSGNKATNAGTYTITVTGTGKYQGTVTVKWTIAKKSVTVTVDNKTMIAGNALPEFTATVVGCFDGEALVYTAKTVADGKVEGDFDITADYTENANYDVTVVPGTLKVSKARVRAYAANNAKCKYFNNIADALEYTMSYNDYGPVYVLDDITVTETIVFNDPIANTIELQGIAKAGKYPTVTCTDGAVPFIKMEAGRLSVKNLVIKTVGDAFLVTGGQLNLQSAGNGQTLEIISQNGSCLVVEGGSAGVLGATTLESETGSAIKGTENGTGKVTVGAWSTYTSAPDVVAPEGVPAIGGLDSEDVSIQSGSFSSNVSDFCDEGYAMTQKDGSWVAAKAVAKNSKTDTDYATLKEAIEKATAGQTIIFLADITEDVTISKNITIVGADFTYTGKMTLKADTTIKNVNFDGKGYNGYAVETRGANYLTIEDCTAKNYGYGFVQLASGTALTTVKNVTVSNMNYGVKVDYSNAVVLENVDITAGVAAVLNSNYKNGEKTITIKDSKLNILSTWQRTDTVKTTYVFEGENTVGQFKTVDGLDFFKLAANATLTAPANLGVKTVGGKDAAYVDGKYVNVVVVYENMEFDNTLALLFAIPQWEEIKYVKLGENFIEITNDLETTEIGGVTYYVVKSEGFAAKQMTDIVEVTLCDANKVALGDTLESSIQKYADSVLKDANTSDNLKKVVTDMLKYGAAAQKHFDKETNENKLADFILKDNTLTADAKYKDYQNDRAVYGVSRHLFTASGVRFNDSITMVFQFENIYPEGAKITFKINGQEVEGDFELTKVEGEENVYAVEFVDLTIADAKAVITCTITKNNDVLTITDSVASYVARRLKNADVEASAANLYTAFMNFANSAVEYASKQQ